MIKRGVRIAWFTVAILADVATTSAWASGDVTVALGSREDYVRWSISDFDRDPNIYSELTWENLRSYYAAIHGSYEVDNLVITGFFGRGYIVSGDNQDSDYDFSDRQGEFSRSNNQSDGNSVMDREIAVGLSLLERRQVRLAAGIGYANRVIDLVMTNGYQTVSTPGRTPPIGPIDNLRSTYSAKLSGPLVWFSTRWHFHPAATAGLNVKTGFYSYTANANWNLRTDFQHPRSFSQSADGTSNSIGLLLNWAVAPDAMLSLGLDYHRFTATGGHTRFYLSNGSVGQQPIHAVELWNWVLAVGLGVEF